MMFKGYPNWKMLKNLGALAVDALYPTIQRLSGYKNGLDCYVHQYHQLIANDSVDALLVQANDDATIIGIRANASGARVGDLIRFTSGTSQGLEVKVFKIKDANFFYLAEPIEAGSVSVADTFSLCRPTQPKVESDGSMSVSLGTLSIVDFMDTPTLIPSTTTIPKSSDNAIEIVASLAAAVTEIQTIEDIGNFMAIYSDAARTSLICFLPLAGGNVKVSIAAGTAIYLGAVYDTDIDTADTALMMHFLG